jgi:predicted transcriptional regulator of viral defense system
MNNQSNIEKLLTSSKSVVTVDDLAVIWQAQDRRKLHELIKHYLRSNKLVRLHKGVYVYGSYTILDLAQKLVPLSYISLHTASQMHGLTFQNYTTVFCMSLVSKKMQVGEQKFEYHKLKQVAFYCPFGLIQRGQYLLAGPERTVCDMLYVYPGIAFDNLPNLDESLLNRIAWAYSCKRLARDVRHIVMHLKEQQ